MKEDSKYPCWEIALMKEDPHIQNRGGGTRNVNKLQYCVCVQQHNSYQVLDRRQKALKDLLAAVVYTAAAG